MHCNHSARALAQTKNIHHDLDSSRALVSGSLERGAVARGGRLGQARGGGRARGKKAPAWIFFSGLILLLLTLLTPVFDVQFKRS